MEIQLDLTTTPLNLDHTLRCGQAFRWGKLGDWWYGVIRETVVKIRQINEKLEFQTFPKEVGTNLMKDYFRLDDNLPHILSQINKDEQVKRAIQNFYGLRILRQEPWECLISYICATNSNIPAIKNMIHNLSGMFGRKITFEGHAFYTFPKPSDLTEAHLEELRRCRLGFRAELVLETSRTIVEGGFDLEALREMTYEEAKRELLSRPGVGQKVADCVLLFSLDKLEAFPMDVWMKRIVLGFYSGHFEKSFIDKISCQRSLTHRQYREISSFGRRYFGEYAGYAQQYLFYYERRRS
ncbi:MAG: hypothetical protein AOA65_1751 [Candidatus Bathyarchaeota archaeon BA1]|nr:MAG: hypothetical protein AOA65_1751 [Candidatus Bathyarchaeota archaeon BA1]